MSFRIVVRVEGLGEIVSDVYPFTVVGVDTVPDAKAWRTGVEADVYDKMATGAPLAFRTEAGKIVIPFERILTVTIVDDDE